MATVATGGNELFRGALAAKPKPTGWCRLL